MKIRSGLSPFGVRLGDIVVTAIHRDLYRLHTVKYRVKSDATSAVPECTFISSARDIWVTDSRKVKITLVGHLGIVGERMNTHPMKYISS